MAVALIPLEDLRHMRPVLVQQLDDSLDIVEGTALPGLHDIAAGGVDNGRPHLLVQRLLGDLELFTAPKAFPGVDMSEVVAAARSTSDAITGGGEASPVATGIVDLVASARRMLDDVRTQPYM